MYLVAIADRRNPHVRPCDVIRDRPPPTHRGVDEDARVPTQRAANHLRVVRDAAGVGAAGSYARRVAAARRAEVAKEIGG